jgi:hypothetical protein
MKGVAENHVGPQARSILSVHETRPWHVDTYEWKDKYFAVACAQTYVPARTTEKWFIGSTQESPSHSGQLLHQRHSIPALSSFDMYSTTLTLQDFPEAFLLNANSSCG